LITKSKSPVFFRQCTLHEESLPPPYREDVKAMIEKGFKDKPKVLQFDLGVDIYPFQR
jgi:small subunit ribosomal protein S6